MWWGQYWSACSWELPAGADESACIFSECRWKQSLLAPEQLPGLLRGCLELVWKSLVATTTHGRSLLQTQANQMPCSAPSVAGGLFEVAKLYMRFALRRDAQNVRCIDS